MWFELLLILGAAIWIGLLIAPWAAWRTTEHLEASSAPNTPISPHQDQVSVLIPARNEAKVISKTLRSLAAQADHLPVILVDDQSDDGTAAVAKSTLNHLQVISGQELPPGWTGKMWALEQGLRSVKTAYVLVIDADIELQPGILRAMQEKMQTDGTDFLSLMAELSFESFWEKLLMPAYIYFFKLLYPFRLANSPSQRFAAGAGGCILMKTDALRAIGGYKRIQNSLIDDCSLAKAFKLEGFRIWIGLTRSVTSHRIYRGLSEIWSLVARSAFTYLHYSVALLILCSLCLAAAFWALPMGLTYPPSSWPFLLSLVGLGAMVATYLPTLRFYKLSPLWALMLPLSGSLYLLMVWTSAVRYWRGSRSQWKDRTYSKDLNTAA